MQESKASYDGEISDGHSSLRFCGISATAHKKECYENSEPVLLDGCKVKKTRQRDGLETLVKFDRNYKITKIL